MPECLVSEAPPDNYAQEYFYQPNNLLILRKDFTMAEINKVVKFINFILPFFHSNN